jgi:hypothetical protein
MTEKRVSVVKILLLFSFSSAQNPVMEKWQNIEKHTHKKRKREIIKWSTI